MHMHESINICYIFESSQETGGRIYKGYTAKCKRLISTKNRKARLVCKKDSVSMMFLLSLKNLNLLSYQCKVLCTIMPIHTVTVRPDSNLIQNIDKNYDTKITLLLKHYVPMILQHLFLFITIHEC